MNRYTLDVATSRDRKINSAAGLVYLLLVAAVALGIALGGGLLNSL